MSKKKQEKRKDHRALDKPASKEDVSSGSPYLPVAHPPAKSGALLVISAILFAAWFIFLVAAALYS